MRIKNIVTYIAALTAAFALCAYGASEMEYAVMEKFQGILNTDPAYKGYEAMVTDVVFVLVKNPESGGIFGTIKDIAYNILKGIKHYEGTITILLDEREYKIKTAAMTAGNDKTLTWEPPTRQQTAFLNGIITVPLVPVVGGAFTMGCDDRHRAECYSNESPAFAATVGNFYIGRFPVTQGLWKRLMGGASGANPSVFKGDDLPVENVSWDDAQRFISKLNAATGHNYRLPTEAEWEYAARGGANAGGFVYAGSGNIDNVAWYYTNSEDRTHRAGNKQPNELGIYDMSGNVWEWVNDRYGPYSGGQKSNPIGASSGSTRVNRGGSWRDDERRCRVSCRSNNSPDARYGNLGFRLARTPIMPFMESRLPAPSPAAIEEQRRAKEELREREENERAAIEEQRRREEIKRRAKTDSLVLLAERTYGKAETYLNEKRFFDAIEQYNKAMKLQQEAEVETPGYKYMVRGYCYHQIKAFESAVEDYKRALQKDPNLKDKIEKNINSAEKKKPPKKP